MTEIPSDLKFNAQQIAVRTSLLRLSVHVEDAAKELDQLLTLDDSLGPEIKVIADALNSAIASSLQVNELVERRVLAHNDAKGAKHDG